MKGLIGAKAYVWSHGERVRFRAIRIDVPSASSGGEVDTVEHAHAVISLASRIARIPLTVVVRARPGRIGRA